MGREQSTFGFGLSHDEAWLLKRALQKKIDFGGDCGSIFVMTSNPEDLPDHVAALAEKNLILIGQLRLKQKMAFIEVHITMRGEVAARLLDLHDGEDRHAR